MIFPDAVGRDPDAQLVVPVVTTVDEVGTVAALNRLHGHVPAPVVKLHVAGSVMETPLSSATLSETP